MKITPQQNRNWIAENEDKVLNAMSSVDLIRSMLLHREYVELGLKKLSNELEERSLCHDLSKFRTEEFFGFATINRVARSFKYGSKEYDASKDKNETIERHYSNNSHHPEHFKNPKEEMTALDIIEMVVDWWSACKTYNTTDWKESIEVQKSRFKDVLSREQWWLVDQIVEFLGE